MLGFHEGHQLAELGSDGPGGVEFDDVDLARSVGIVGLVAILYEGGLSWMRYSISDTAEYGDYTRGSRIVNEATKAEMRKVLDEIQSGAFANEWLAQAREGAPFLLEQRAANRKHPIEIVGAELRELMPFMKPKHAP